MNVDLIAIFIAIGSSAVAVASCLIAHRQLRVSQELAMGERVKQLYLFACESLELMKKMHKDGKNIEDYLDESYLLDHYCAYVTLIKKNSCKENNSLNNTALKIRNQILEERKSLRSLNEEQKKNLISNESILISNKNISNFEELINKIRKELISLEV